MTMFRNILLSNNLSAGKFSLNDVIIRSSIHMGRIVPEIDQDLAAQVEIDPSFDLKKIKTRRNYGFVPLPAKLHAVAELKLSEFSDRTFRKEAKYLNEVMHKLKLPDDPDTLKLKKGDIRNELELRDKINPEARYDPSEFKLQELEKVAKNELQELVLGVLEERRRDWHYYEYDERASNLYMATRLAPNYACIKTVMGEIKSLDPEYKPGSVLDFGSGMGTAMWAVNETWPDSVSEFMNVDLSKEQQHLCEYLMRDGREDIHSPPGMFHRQYLPGSDKVQYDMVVSAFSLLELPNRETRASIIENLWHKTRDLLVIIERGNKGGFITVSEARHLILELTGHGVTKKLNYTPESRPILRRTTPESHILAPCSHEFTCPRLTMPGKRLMDVCRFKVTYELLEIGEKKGAMQNESFSYVVIRKKTHPGYTDNYGTCLRWPRIVEKRKKSGGQITHKLCCPNGNIAETIITKRYGKPTYNLAKSCDWGDILPVKVKDTYQSRNWRLIKDS